MTRTRMGRRERYDIILSAALRVACDVGYNRITRDDIAMAAGCSPALVSDFFGTMPSLRRTIVRAAITQRVLPVVAQALAIRDPHALRAPQELRDAAAAALGARV